MSEHKIWDLIDLEYAVDTRDGMRNSYTELLQELVIASEKCLDESYSGDAGDISSDFQNYIEDKVKRIREHLDLMGSHQSLMEDEIKKSEELMRLGANACMSATKVSELQRQEGYLI